MCREWIHIQYHNYKPKGRRDVGRPRWYSTQNSELYKKMTRSCAGNGSKYNIIITNPKKEEMWEDLDGTVHIIQNYIRR